MTLLLYAVISGVAYAILGVLYKYAEQKHCRPEGFMLAFLCTGGVITLGKALTEPTTWLDVRFWSLGIVLGLLTYASVRLLMVANAHGPASIPWTMLNLSLILPILLAPMLFHEKIFGIDIVALLAFMGMLVLFARSMPAATVSPTSHRIFLPAALGVMLTDGICMLGNKVKDIWFPDANTAGLPAISFLTAALCAAIVLFRRQGLLRLERREWQVGLWAGLICSVGIVSLLSAMRLPVIVSLPVIKGLALVGGVVLYRVLFREEITPLRATGLVLGGFTLLLVTSREPLDRWMILLLAGLFNR